MTSVPLKIRVAALSIIFLGLVAGFFASADRFPGLRDVPVLSRFIRSYRLGLDLQGGTHLLYRADFTDFPAESSAEAMEGLRDVIERRVNLFGVTEPVVQVERAGDEWRLIVELAGVRDIREAINMIGETPFLEFKEPRPAEETSAILEAQGRGERIGEDPYFIPSGLTGRYLKRAEMQFDPTTNAPLIGVEFNDEGSLRFEAITERNVGKPIGIYLDGVPLSLPTVREKIAGGRAQITGEFTLTEARGLVRRLNSGALPVPIALVSQQSVDSALGAESLARSLVAALAGFAAVAVFMLFWYRLPGFIAVAALAMYAALVLAIFKLVPVTLTAAGIAGFVLSLGMAVDANILIFERMKEELRAGKALEAAVADGFRRAWTSIRDSNVSSMITAAVLYWLGTSVVKGFALTLGIGVLVSMLSAISISRTFLFTIVTPWASRHRGLFLSGSGR
ncbi:MAG: protein-export membrane protein SecD [Candidatus Sungbacteria bacterium RIFCSPLOWO2_01_FULL_59_16]|uniref:Protein translocase subunit SecD n=1 Tax=Candidatus Sungbacteria bacterium RIFCSPLOWO2_01_FULL_59_16 TaxID=1802280 RepID=A0A1G2LA46_9BACT|nr:MAG: protein-export membrane protein SecD [Candidatus Sungbacteria bacterium RIFCSPLOWO2_01_FULL_59_16]